MSENKIDDVKEEGELEDLTPEAIEKVAPDVYLDSDGNLRRFKSTKSIPENSSWNMWFYSWYTWLYYTLFDENNKKDEGEIDEKNVEGDESEI